MGAKDIILKPIKSRQAIDFVKKHHYSGKVVNNSQLHFGVYYNNILGGVMQYGPSTDKSKLIGLIEGTKRNEFIELNRMAFSDLLPRNSESRAIAISIKLIKKHAPHIKWIISFADGCQCGDGTIYRAAGFELSQIKENNRLIKLPDGRVEHQLSFEDGNSLLQKEKNKAGFNNTIKFLNAKYPGRIKIPGYMLRYIKQIHPNLKSNYKTIPYSEIQKLGAGMYLGEKR